MLTGEKFGMKLANKKGPNNRAFFLITYKRGGISY